MRRLFIGIGELEQHGLAKGQPEERNAYWQIVARKSRRHCDPKRLLEASIEPPAALIYALSSRV